MQSRGTMCNMGKGSQRDQNAPKEKSEVFPLFTENRRSVNKGGGRGRKNRVTTAEGERGLSNRERTETNEKGIPAGVGKKKVKLNARKRSWGEEQKLCKKRGGHGGTGGGTI